MKGTKLASVLLFIATIGLTVLFWQFRDYALHFRSLGLLGLFLINGISSAALFNPAPTFITVVIGGTVYSPFLVALVAGAGSAAGDLFSYIIGVSGRKVFHHHLKKKKWFTFVEDHFRMFGGIILFLAAFIPDPMFDPIGMLAGMASYSPVHYYVLVFAGRFLRFLALAYFGHHFFR